MKVSLNIVIAKGMIIIINSHLQLTDSVIYLFPSASGRVSHKHQIYLLSLTTVHYLIHNLCIFKPSGPLLIRLRQI